MADSTKEDLSDRHNMLGIELADRGWFEEAEEQFRRAVSLDAAAAHAWDNLAAVLAEKKRWIESIEAYLTALRVDADNPSAHYDLACFLSTFAGEMAIAHYRRALELEPEFPDARVNLGLAYADRGMIDEAIREMRSALKIDSNDEGARHELAALLMDKAEYVEATRHLRVIVRRQPAHIEAHVDLGHCYLARGFYERAEAAYREALRLNRADLNAHYNLAALYAAWGKVGPALRHLRTALRIDAAKVREWAVGDDLFDGVRDDRRFRSLLQGA
jgi:tetratricopeptide (TPR) repeat protein